MPMTYVAQTRDHLLMLDGDGVCLYVHRRGHGPDEAAEWAVRCVGAQYVAALDANQPGLLAHEPVVGAPMLFAKVSESGRISVVRTEPIERFEARGSGIYDSGPVVWDLESTVAIEFLPDDCVEEDDHTMRFRRPSKAGAPIRVRVVNSRLG